VQSRSRVPLALRKSVWYAAMQRMKTTVEGEAVTKFAPRLTLRFVTLESRRFEMIIDQ